MSGAKPRAVSPANHVIVGKAELQMVLNCLKRDVEERGMTIRGEIADALSNSCVDLEAFIKTLNQEGK